MVAGSTGLEPVASGVTEGRRDWQQIAARRNVAQLLELTVTEIVTFRQEWQDFARRELHLSYSP
jgi:hypothetical protein